MTRVAKKKIEITLRLCKQKMSRTPATLQVPGSLQQQIGFVGSGDGSQQQQQQQQTVTSFYLSPDNAGPTKSTVQFQVPIITGNGAGAPVRGTAASATATADAKTPFIRDLGVNYQSTQNEMMLNPVGQRHAFEMSFKEARPAVANIHAATSNVLINLHFTLPKI